jgi:ribosome-associated heat shock protein Hsp15
MPEPDSGATLRIDKWLWAARAFKTRSIAAQACTGGAVTVNDTGAKPHKPVRVGDIVVFRSGLTDRRWKVLAIAERRGPASVAQTLYEDLTPPPPPRPAATMIDGWRYAQPDSGRPNKRERRQLERLKRG